MKHFLLVIIAFALSSVVQAADITVTNNADSGAGSLRQAILDANPGDTILFNGNMTINHLSDLPSIDFELTIDGEANNIILRGNATTRSGVVLEDGADVTLRNLTMENGSIDSGSNGGAIDTTEDNQGTDFAINGDFPKKLTIEGCTFQNNDTVASFNGRTSNGGAIAAEGTRLIIRDSSFINNVTDETSNDTFNNGGAIYLRNGHLTIERSFFDNNTARNGGAIWIDGSFEKIDTVLHISDSTFEDNESSKPLVTNFSYEGGGAIYFGPYVRDTWIRGSLFERNVSAARGGALRNRNIATNKPARIENSTFYDNHADNRGGAFELERASVNHVTVRANSSGLHAGGILLTQNSTMRNSIIVDNGIAVSRTSAITTPDDCSAFLTDIEYTLIETATSLFSPSSYTCDSGAGTNNLIGVNPNFATTSPANNGGETESIALNAGSPAIGAGELESCLAVDQRGYVRQGSSCDLGAVEDAPAHRCVTWDGVTQRGTFTGEALHLALAANTGNDIKIAGKCEGATNVGDVIGSTDDDIVAAYIDESISLEGGHKAFDWNQLPNVAVNPSVIDALGLGRTVLIAANKTVSLRHLILQNGAVLTTSTGVDGSGGGVYAADNSNITLDNVTVQGSSANSGSGIYAQQNASLTINNSTIRDNYAFNRGGGLNLKTGSTATISDSTFHDNLSGSNGAGIHATAGSGLITIKNSTISSNKGARGAGLRIDSTASVLANNVTIAANRSSNASFEVGISNGGDLTLINSLVSDNVGGTGDCANLGAGATSNITFTLIEDGSCGITNGLNGNATGDPDLNVLGPNDNNYEKHEGTGDRVPIPTWTHAISDVSAARNKGSSVSCEQNDQRNFTRTDGSCDMGAFEYDGEAMIAPPSFVVEPNKWQQIGLPCQPAANENTLADLIADDITGTLGTDWAIYSWSDAAGVYQALGLTDTLEPGTGYWLIHLSPGDAIIDIPQSCSMPTLAFYGPAFCNNNNNGCFEIPLEANGTGPAWNMIAHPFRQSVDWDLVTIIDDNLCVTGCDLSEAQTNNVFNNEGWQYNPDANGGAGGYDVQSTENLDEWEGFWSATLPGAVNPRMLIPFR